MRRILFVLLALESLLESQADVNVTDYVYWKKEDINQYHQFFPSRALEEERRTTEAAASAVQSIASSISDDLSKIVAFQYRELQTAQQLMAGTDAEGCINGISHFLDHAIQDQVDTYDDCTADVLSKLARLNNTWTRTRTTYLVAYQRALSGIDACAKTYPNKESIDRLRSCVESMNTNYFTTANNTQSSVSPSPSMSYFQNTVVECASDAAKAVTAKGSQFLKMLVDCAALSGTVDPKSYAEELSHWKEYNVTLSDQIVNSQNSNYYQVFAVELQMKNYYNMQKQALEKYVIESRGQNFYLEKIYSYLSDYYNTVTATSLDNPGGSECATAARNSLDQAVNTSAALSLSCDEKIVNDTRRLMADVYKSFLSLNLEMPSIGNVALLDCFSQGLVFAPETIEKCFKLTYTEFELDSSDTLDVITKDTLILADYISSFFSNTQLPCGNFSLKRVVLDAEKVLYDLQRCLYAFSGTSYKVSTPAYTTVTPKITTTTQPPTYSSTTCWCPYSTSTEAYSSNKTTGYAYNTTTEASTYDRTTTGYPYNRTTEASTYDRTKTEASTYDRTITEVSTYDRTTTEASTYDRKTTEASTYDRTTEASTYDITTTGTYPYTKTTGWYSYPTTTESYPYSRTTGWIPYKTSTFKTTSRLPFSTTYKYSSSTYPSEKDRKHKKKGTSPVSLGKIYRSLKLRYR